ncbi:DNA phosphorothioation system sulfurtransferase DndC [Helicobacter mustelae]|uniref:Putative phosphoadenosine phosphosulphate reductase n=1 Tax=Helicobacter mustelae (strain ATCC 43772 / CCUG 25715 / CIP 103759 / LMG 18044 / NCTC 12198 / R85-136P) TaxID=679897 RepID=D3UIZ3_HELM1|nr:DNA phosphorothioation system sulfurtransferase DndC [Helicobacter mustelae]CBG40468.1 putative phosphoadenosine phosphosulphate reductase [Helicobacter mustelae 12198]
MIFHPPFRPFPPHICATYPTKQQSLIAHTKNELKEKFLSTSRTFVIAFSGGKDSTCVLQLFYEMLASLPKHLQRQSYAIASNTLVEAPHIERFLQRVIHSINLHAMQNNIPFEVLQVTPELKDDFFVNLIGKGYPSPTRTFRWCTDRLKITPSKNTIAQITKKHGLALLVLGTREAESSNRKKSMQKRVLDDHGFSKHEDYPDTMIYAPLSKWDTDLVWTYLSTHKPLWDMSHGELFRLYAKASGEECQFITHLAQSSCGGSRFGCWVCTVVSEDKSLQGFIDTGEEHLKPLNEFRNYIKALREDPNARADYRRDGRVAYRVGGRGAFLSHIRIEILEKLLACEKAFLSLGGEGELISKEQILAIQREWNKDFDFHESALRLGIKYNKGVSMNENKSKILQEEIIDEICASTENAIVDPRDIKALLKESINIHNNYAIKGRNNAGQRIGEEIKKLLDDKSSKEA